MLFLDFIAGHVVIHMLNFIGNKRCCKMVEYCLNLARHHIQTIVSKYIQSIVLRMMGPHFCQSFQDLREDFGRVLIPYHFVNMEGKHMQWAMSGPSSGPRSGRKCPTVGSLPVEAYTRVCFDTTWSWERLQRGVL